MDKLVKYKDIEDAEIEAYLILMSIRKCITEENDIVHYFRDDDLDNGYPLIQTLLYCGTRCPDKSIISLEAFKILDIVFNGSKKMGIKPWKLTEKEKKQLSFYTEYADEMVFDSTNITYKMIHSIPIFWNHRYNFDKYILSDEEKEKVDISDYFCDCKTYFRERIEGETALEIIQPLLICKPLVSSQLIYSCIDIFDKLSFVKECIFKTKRITKAKRDLLSEIDGIFHDFYKHHFNFGKTHTDISFSELGKYSEMTLLNGFIVDFFLGFQFDHDKLYTESSSIKKTFYNIPDLFEFYLVYDDEEEENEEEEDIDSKVKSKFHTKPIKIGEGSTSISYKFMDIKMKTLICKKVIKYKYNDIESFEVAKKGLRELDIHRNISHPCICKLYGINFNERIKIIEGNIKKETTTIALFLEFVDYKLSDILEMQINNTTKTRIVLELAHAMNFLHKHGIMHRNLKIECIMINSSFETKLAKFYYASDRFSDSTNSLAKEIRELAYISPEIASGKEYDNKTDVYSFGAVMYEIFTGKPPMQSLDDKIKGKEVKLPNPSSSISKFCIKLIKQCKIQIIHIK